jgi:hypothetical protein
MSWKLDLASEIRANYRVGQVFSLTDLYRQSETQLQTLYPANSTVRDTIRRVLQQLRNDGHVEFVDDRGNYRRLN